MSKQISLTLIFILTGLAAGQIGENMKITGQIHDYQTRIVEGADIAIFEIHRDDIYSPASAKLLDKIKKTDHQGRFVFNVTATPFHDIYVIAQAGGWDRSQRLRGLVLSASGFALNSLLQL